MSQIHTFVTDRLDSEPLRQVCAAHGVQIVEALPDSVPEETLDEREE